MKRHGIGSHTKPNRGTSDIWLTGQQIISRLGQFDLDPCAAPSPRPWSTAVTHIEPPQDGKALPWFGRVWLNPPYGKDIGEWLKLMAAHRRGIALTFARTDIEAWKRHVWPFADSFLFIYGRLYFYLPDGTRAAGNSGGPSVLISYSQEDTAILATSGIDGRLLRNIDLTRR